MRRSLAGESGSMVGLDYHGELVLAAYEPVALLSLGVVAKVDLAEIRSPFIQTGSMVVGVALVLIVGGTFLFVRLTGPMIRQLRESERRYRRIFNGAEIALWEQDASGVRSALRALRANGVVDLRTYLAGRSDEIRRLMQTVRVADANAATLQMLGIRSESELAEWFRARFIPQAKKLCADLLCAVWDGRKRFVAETNLPTAVRGERLRVILSMPIPETREAFRNIPVSMLDVSRDVLLRQREQELDLILASTGEGIFGMDVDGRCSFANRAAARMLGYRDGWELLGRDMHELMHHTRPDGTPHPRERCPVLVALGRDQAIDLREETLWRADGTSFPAEYRAYPMRRDGEVVGLVATFTDVSERKEHELQLAQAQKMELMGRLTGGIAHDFNNLLTIIMGNLRLLSDELSSSSDPELEALIADALSASRDGADLTQRLLAFARKQTLRPQRVDANAFIRKSRRFLSRLTGEDVDVKLCLEDGPLPVLVDPHQLHSALLNLTINSRDAMPEGGHIAIGSRRRRVEAGQTPEGVAPGDYVVLSVTDDGTGMSREKARRAVEPFFTTKAPSKGSGLGLSMVYGFARQSGGGVVIDSAPGAGTTVSLYLPQADRPVGPAEAPRDEAPWCAGGESVLIVEDEPRVRSFAARCLAAAGYEVICVADADEARQTLESGTVVDVLFTDIVMPGEMNGRALARWALEHTPGMKVLLTTGFSDELHYAGEGAESGLPVLEKPYTRRSLCGALSDVIRGTRAAQRRTPEPIAEATV
jgi:PAS domain S-box-containing protein